LACQVCHFQNGLGYILGFQTDCLKASIQTGQPAFHQFQKDGLLGGEMVIEAPLLTPADWQISATLVAS